MNEESVAISESNEETLRIYISYDGFLTADQITSLLRSLDNAYNYLYISHNSSLSLPLPIETRMRIKETRTGQSIILEIVEGIQQLWNSSQPTLEVLGPIGAIPALALLLTSFGKSIVAMRNAWIESTGRANKDNAKAEKTRAEAERIKAKTENLRNTENQKKPVDDVEHSSDQLKLSDVPDEYQRVITNELVQLYTNLVYDSNIRLVSINDVIVLQKESPSSSDDNYNLL